MEDSAHPKISCLMVTANRPQLCRRAVRCYTNQDYPDKELIVVDDGDVDLSEVLAEIPPSEVTYVKLPPDPSNVLGHLRNVALDHAKGAYVAQWDDDDWYHPTRLTRQAAALTDGFDACTLAATLMHVDTPEFFDHPYAGYLAEGVPGTIMHRNDPSIRYPETKRGEDSVFLDAWKRRRHIELPSSTMHLFIRCYHGTNTWEVGHFLRRVRNSPLDMLSYFWYSVVRRDPFSHPRFRLSDDSRAAFEKYLEESRIVGLFQ